MQGHQPSEGAALQQRAPREVAMGRGERAAMLPTERQRWRWRQWPECLRAGQQLHLQGGR